MAKLIVFLIILVPLVASADERVQLAGVVTDSQTGAVVPDTTLYIAGTSGLAHVVTTDRHGHYSIDLPPGTYQVVFVHGTSRTSKSIVVESGHTTVLDGQVDAISGETIEINGWVAPSVPPKAKKDSRILPRYSDEAALTDAWEKAWMLLDLDTTGKVTRVKFLHRPGHDLAPIAVETAFATKFEPARDRQNRPVRTLVIWPIEWPSYWWVVDMEGVVTRMPAGSQHVPCRGDGPMNLDSLHPGYRDCSRPDLTKIESARWIYPRPH
jgi:carboxypeptidase family protein